MKKTQLIDILRMIRSSKAFCITMIVVTALSIATYTGISFATDSLTQSCDKYYDEYNFYDIQFGSVYGFNDSTMEKIRNNEYVNDAQAAYYTQELITVGQDDYVAEIYTEAGELNAPRLVSGRLPEKDGECAVEQALMKRFGLKMGDTITLPNASDMLNSQEYRIVGSVELVTVFANNDFYNRGTSDLGDGQVATKIMVSPDAFCDDALRQICYVTVKDRGQRGSAEYDTYVQEVRDELMPIVEEGGSEEYERLHSDYQTEIDEAQEDYEEGAQELADGKDAIADAEQKLNKERELLASKQREFKVNMDKLDEAKKELESYAKQLASSRKTLDNTAGQLSDYKQKLDSAAVSLDNAKSQLDASRSQLDATKSQLDTAATTLQSQKAQLDSTASQLGTDGQALNQLSEQLNTQQAALASLKESLAQTDPSSTEYGTLQQQCAAQEEICDKLQQTYDSNNTKYQEALTQYNAAKSQYESAEAQYTEQNSAYQNNENLYSTSLAEYQNEKAAYDSQLDQYNSSYSSYQAAEKEYASGLKLYQKYQKEYEENAAALNEGKQQLQDAEEQINSASTELADKKTELEEKSGELKDAAQDLEQAKQELKDMPLSESFSSDINANSSYYYFSQITHGTNTVIATLCVLLMAIAILVCFTSISRMVTEQHRIIGTQKAMGFLPHEIYGKYIIYVSICTLCGIIIGLILSYFVMQKMVFVLVYGESFILQDFKATINWPTTFIIAALEMFFMCLSAFFACRSMLKKSAIALLNSNIRGNKTWKKSSHFHLPLRIGMVLRNLQSNPQILITTLVSVMGCTILMIAVCTVYHGMSGISDRQYKELQHYQGTLTINKDADQDDLDEMHALVENTDAVQLFPVMEKLLAFETEDSTQYATLIGIDPKEDASPFIEILDADTLETMQVPEEGVLICKKLAETFGYSTGDKFILLDSMGGKHETYVAGIFDRNIGLAIIASPDYYAKLMDTDAEIYQYYVMGSADAVDAFLDEARECKAYCNYSDADYFRSEMEGKVRCLSGIVLLIMVITGLLSLFVLFNLAQMNIRKKEKDIVVMKVLGFPEKRVYGYVFWEAMIMCTIGLILGVLIGGPLGSYLSKVVELSNMQDIRGISISACLLGGGINFAFYTMTNLFSLTGIKKIKMTGSAREA